MAQASTFLSQKRYAVVTGANKGIGYEICKQLASNGITVILTARDNKKGQEAVENLKKIDGLSELVIFHQLSVTDPLSIASLATFIKSTFGKLDILVNNAAVGGLILDCDAMVKASELEGSSWPEKADWSEFSSQTHVLAKECLETNYYGTKRMVEAMMSLLQLSTSPRIVNVSSNLGMLKNIPSEQIRGVFSDVEFLTEEKLDEILIQFLQDIKEGKLETKGWPRTISAYKLSKVSMNAYTRILANKFPKYRINCVHPGYVKTDMTCNVGLLTTAQGAESPVMLAMLPDNGPSGHFFFIKEDTCF